MELQYNITDNAQEFFISGKLDFESYTDFDDFIIRHHKKGLDVVLNLEQLSYISSVGLRSFITLAKLVHDDHKQIKVKAKEGTMVKTVIELSGFKKIMPFI